MPEPTDPLTPTAVLLCKLGSALVHAEEMTEFGFSEFDVASFMSLASDPEVVEWRAAMDALALLPKKAERLMPPTTPTDVLTREAAKLAAGLETGTSSSTVKQEWGCGHSVWRVNGDPLYSACPICHAEKIAR